MGMEQDSVETEFEVEMYWGLAQTLRFAAVPPAEPPVLASVIPTVHGADDRAGVAVV